MRIVVLDGRATNPGDISWEPLAALGELTVYDTTPPELAADIMRSGIHLTGGGAQLFAMDQFIATELGIPVLIAKEPEDCTVMGLGYLVENMQLLASIGKQGLMND